MLKLSDRHALFILSQSRHWGPRKVWWQALETDGLIKQCSIADHPTRLQFSILKSQMSRKINEISRDQNYAQEPNVHKTFHAVHYNDRTACQNGHLAFKALFSGTCHNDRNAG